LCQFQWLAQVLLAFAYKLVVERSGIHAHKVVAPLAGNGASGKTFSATLDARDQDSLRRNQAKLPAFRGPGAFALGDPITQSLQPNHVLERSVAFDVFEQSLRMQGLAFAFRNVVEEPGVCSAAR
jgi:hypothetical protein